MRAFVGEAKAAAMLAGILTIVAGVLYIQFRIIHDCGWMSLFHGSEWWWLFGYCG